MGKGEERYLCNPNAHWRQRARHPGVAESRSPKRVLEDLEQDVVHVAWYARSSGVHVSDWEKQIQQASNVARRTMLGE